MPDQPYDWEADDDRRSRRADEHWYRQPDDQPLLAGQFWALWSAHMAQFEQLKERVEQNEHRLLEERGKAFVYDLWSAFWGKLFVIVSAIVTAYVLTNYLHGWRP